MKESKKPKDPKKGGGDEPADASHEEQEYPKEYDYLYILYDFPETQADWALIQDLNNMNFAVSKLYLKEMQSRITDEDIEWHNAIDDVGKFEDDLRKRLNEFFNSKEENGEDGDAELDTEGLSSLTKASQIFIEKLKDFKKNSKKSSQARNWNWYEIAFNENDSSDTETPWEFLFRDQFYQMTATFSNDFAKFKSWLGTVKRMPLTAPVQLIIETPEIARSELQGTPEEPLESPTKGGRKPAPKGLKVPEPIKKPLPGKLPVKSKTDLLPPPESPMPDPVPAEEKKRPQIPAKTSKKPFEVYNMQLSSVNIKACCEGAILEALGDDIEALKTGELNSKLPVPFKDSDQYMNYLDDVMNHFTGNVLGNYHEKIFSNRVNDPQPEEKYDTIINEANTIEGRTMGERFNNGDSLYDRQSMLISGLNLIGLNRHMMGNSKHALEQTSQQKMEQTSKCSVVDMDLREYNRKNHILNVEKMFTEQVGLVEWNFSDRIYAEKFDDASLRNI